MAVMTGMVDALSRYLDLTADSMKLTAGNMANIDTPGYKTQGFDFEREFTSGVAGTVRRLLTTVRRWARWMGWWRDRMAIRFSMDRESLEMAKAQLKFRLGTQLLKHEFAGMMSAIHADTK